MYCSNCGNKMENGDKFCRFCGKEIIYNQTNDNNIDNIDNINNVNNNVDNISNNINNITNINNINNVNNKKVEETTNNKIEDKYFNKLKGDYLNLFRLLLSFEGTCGFHFILMLIVVYSDIMNAESGSVFFLIVAPVLALGGVIPQYIGFIIEKIYNRKQKKYLLILLFIASILTLASVIMFMDEFDCDRLIASILIIHSCLLIVNYFIKLKNVKKKGLLGN